MKLSEHPKLTFISLNVLAALIILFVVGYIVLSCLDNYTKHGFYISVPSFHNLSKEEAEELAAQNNLKVMVIDSIFDENAIPGSIQEQYPMSGAKVKDHRMIQVTLCARNPEQVILPSLDNSSFRQALQTLEAKGFTIGMIEYAPSDFKNLVLYLKHKGSELEAGALLRKGSTIDLVLGHGNEDDNDVTVPRLFGMNVKDAIKILKGNYLNIGQIIPDGSIQNDSDKKMAFVYTQEPAGNTNYLPAGSSVNLYVTLNKQKLTIQDTLTTIE